MFLIILMNITETPHFFIFNFLKSLAVVSFPPSTILDHPPWDSTSRKLILSAILDYSSTDDFISLRSLSWISNFFISEKMSLCFLCFVVVIGHFHDYMCTYV